MALITQADLRRFRPSPVKNLSHFEAFSSDMGSEKRTAARELLAEAKNAPLNKTYDIFLSHKFSDAEQLIALRNLLRSLNKSVYVDWLEDSEIDRSRVNRDTSKRLKWRMRNCRAMLFATTANHAESKWMPWELGYFDGAKAGRVAIAPVVMDVHTHTYRGQEYLGIYPYLDVTNGTLYIHSQINPDKWVTYNDWLTGADPAD